MDSNETATVTDKQVKFSPLRFIQTVWVIEVAALIAFTIIITVLEGIKRVEIWMQALPQLGLLIAGQGAIAAGGPLVSKALENKNGSGS